MTTAKRWATPILFAAATAAGVLFAGQLSSPVQAQADCSSCQPDRYNYATLSGNYRVCVESNATYAFSSAQETAVADGKDYWNGYFSTAGISISFTSVTANPSTPCPTDTDITISIVAPGAMVNVGALAETNLTTNGHGATIHVSGDQLSNGANDWKEMAAHELGHALDFKDVNSPSGCGAQTVMWYANMSMPSSPLCSDKVAASAKYIGGNTSGDDYYDPKGGECYDWYWVTTYYYWNGSSWSYGGESWAYIGEYCGPPPP